MGILTADMRRMVETQLGFVATVCPDGTPNLSPKGSTAVWDDDHLVFADLRSPGTVENLRANASVEINVVDQLVRKGYRFKGTGVGAHRRRGLRAWRPVLRGTRHGARTRPHPRDRDRDDPAGRCRSPRRPTTSGPPRTSCASATWRRSRRGRP